MPTPYEWRCTVCGERSDNRVCRDCYTRLSVPCPDCGRPTPTLTRMGKQASPKCVACTARDNAPTRRIGRTCKVCGQRSAATATFYQVCPSCLAIEAPCPICGGPMPKYRKKGLLRVACSFRCVKALHPTTPEQARRAGRTRFANHVYRSHQNDLARGTTDYQEWRDGVFRRDGFTCQDCGARNGHGLTIELHPHHIRPFATYPELRYEVSNGATLCAECHRERHKHTFIGRSRRRAPGQLRLPIAG